ncbi:MAG: hemerythrin domain-containing protein [Planctomycetota bacterium]
MSHHPEESLHDPTTCSGHHVDHEPSGLAEDALFESLPDGHLVKILMQEHQKIRSHLDDLEGYIELLKLGNDDRQDLLRKIESTGAALIASEPHHRREEEILFPELVSRGFVGPPSVMLAEHVQIRDLKKTVKEEATQLLKDDGDTFRLQAAANEIVGDMREHMSKENNILYPLAVSVIKDEALWADMRQRSDAIGYCCTGH